MSKEAMKYLKPGAIVPVDVQTTALLVNALREALASQGEALTSVPDWASEAIEQPAQQWQSTADKCELQKVPANGSLLTRMMNERVKSNVKQVIELYDSPEQPAQQEPVAYMGTDSDGNPNKFRLNPFSGCVSLYEKPSPVQKPVAYMDICEKNQMSGLRYWSEPDNRHEVPLYTSPPAQRKPLTDEQIWKFWWSRPEVPEGEDDSMEAEFVAAVRAVLAAHGIKGDA